MLDLGQLAARRLIRTVILALVTAPVTLATASVRVHAQANEGQDVVMIEPHYTRIFGSDTMQVGWGVLSPDSKWVVFTYAKGADAWSNSNLWVVSSDGGEPMQLTSGRYADISPVWHPGSDRIAFVSDRPSDPAMGSSGSYVMTLPFDPSAGRATGPPRQVSLEPARSGLAVSPDGRWIAYATARDPDAQNIRVLPATGGTARTVAEYSGRLFTARWSPDGRELYFTYVPYGVRERTIAKVPVDGGVPEEIGKLPELLLSDFSQDGRYLIRPLQTGPATSPEYEIASRDGTLLARVQLGKNMSYVSFTPDGRGLIAVRSDVVAPLRVLPVAGGPSRQVNTATGYDLPWGWTADSREVLFRTQLNGSEVLLAASVESGVAREFPLPEGAEQVVLGRDGRHLLYGLPEPERKPYRLMIYDMVSGATRELTGSFPDRAARQGPRLGIELTGAGGYTLRDGNDFLYFEERGDRLEVRATPPDGPSRLLRAFRLEETVSPLAVHGDRIAFVRESADRFTLFIALAGEGEPRAVLHLEAGRQMGSPFWSHDGRWIAMWHGEPEGTQMQLLLVPIGETGELAGEPVVRDAGARWWWYPRWLPDDSGVILVGLTADTRGDVWLVPLNPDDPPVPLTRDDPGYISWYELSPDGKYIAYASEIPRGSSIWRVDLDDVLQGASN